MNQFPVLTVMHVAAGGISLVSGLAAMLLKKGGKPHRFAGKVFFFSMTAIFITSAIIAIYKDKDFLLMIGLFSFYLVVSGYRSLFHKQLHWSQKPSWLDYLINSMAFLAMSAMFVWGVVKLIIGGEDERQLGIVAIVFGFFGFRIMYSTVKNFVHTPGRKTIWIEGHIAGMIGAYIAAITAFLVVNMADKLGIVAWLLPTALGVPYIIYWTKKYKKPAKTSKYVTRSERKI